MKKKHPGLPFYLLGHSMGSLIARAYLKKLDFTLDGLIISAALRNPAWQELLEEDFKMLGDYLGRHPAPEDASE